MKTIATVVLACATLALATSALIPISSNSHQYRWIKAIDTGVQTWPRWIKPINRSDNQLLMVTKERTWYSARWRNMEFKA